VSVCRYQLPGIQTADLMVHEYILFVIRKVHLLTCPNRLDRLHVSQTNI
jgi:hypothetical protein